MKQRLLHPILLAVWLLACGDATGVVVGRRPVEETVPVQYPLRTVNGWGLPYLVGVTEGGQLEIVAGFISLQENNGEFEMRTLWRAFEFGEFYEELEITTGRFERVPDGLEVITDDGRILFFESNAGAYFHFDGFFSYGYWR